MHASTYLSTSALPPRRPCRQAAAPWPEERLEEIGGRGAAYIQDYLEKRVGGGWRGSR